jgi:hypothetical protein
MTKAVHISGTSLNFCIIKHATPLKTVIFNGWIPSHYTFFPRECTVESIFQNKAFNINTRGLLHLSLTVRSSAEANNFSCILCVQTSSDAHPASYPIGGHFPGGKGRPGRNANHSPHLVPSSRMSRSYTSSPFNARMAVAWQPHCSEK